MLDFDSNKIEVDFTKNAVLEMEFALIEFELNVQTFLDADLHLDWLVNFWLLTLIADNEFFLLGYSIIVSVYNYVDIVAKSNDDAVI